MSEVDLSILLKTKTWEDFFFRTPCVKSSYACGLGCGAVITAHKLRLYRGNVVFALNAGVLTFVFISTFSFIACANERNKKYELIRETFKKQRIMEKSKNN